jgi:hypothetical protein
MFWGCELVLLAAQLVDFEERFQRFESSLSWSGFNLPRVILLLIRDPHSALQSPPWLDRSAIFSAGVTR